MKIAPRNWTEFQHYKDRNPTWIKLHKKLLDDFDFHRLPIASKALAPMLWLLASESPDGSFHANSELIAFRIRWQPQDVEAALSPLIGSGFFNVTEFDSKPLATCSADATPETYKQETEEPLSALPTRKRKSPEETEGFVKFWTVWPRSNRKVDRFKCFEVWRRDGLEAKAAVITDHVGLMKLSRQWRDGYEPAPLKYLKNRRYQDPVMDGGDMATELVA